MSLYNLKTQYAENEVEPGSYVITKFDDDLNVEASYQVSINGCTCPAGHRDTCRHRKMLPLMKDRVDSNWFWDYDACQWVNLLTQDIEEDSRPHSSTPEQGPLKAEVPGSNPGVATKTADELAAEGAASNREDLLYLLPSEEHFAVQQQQPFRRRGQIPQPFKRRV